MTFGCFDELAGFLKAQLVLGHVSSGLQICRAGGYFFLVFRGFRRQRSRQFSASGFVAFLVVLGSDLGGVWSFRIHCRRDPFLSLFARRL